NLRNYRSDGERESYLISLMINICCQFSNSTVCMCRFGIRTFSAVSFRCVCIFDSTVHYYCDLMQMSVPVCVYQSISEPRRCRNCHPARLSVFLLFPHAHFLCCYLPRHSKTHTNQCICSSVCSGCNVK